MVGEGCRTEHEARRWSRKPQGLTSGWVHSGNPLYHLVELNTEALANLKRQQSDGLGD